MLEDIADDLVVGGIPTTTPIIKQGPTEYKPNEYNPNATYLTKANYIISPINFGPNYTNLPKYRI